MIHFCGIKSFRKNLKVKNRNETVILYQTLKCIVVTIFSVCVLLCTAYLMYSRNVNSLLMSSVKGCGTLATGKMQQKSLARNVGRKSKLMSSSAAAFLGIPCPYRNAATLEDSIITSCYLAKLASRSSP